MLQRSSMLSLSLLALVFSGQSLQASAAFLTFSPSTGLNLSGNAGGAAVMQVVTLLNTGSAPTDWVMASSAPWLTTSPARGTALAAGSSVTITVIANPASLIPSSGAGYTASLTPQGSGTSSSLAVTFSVSGTFFTVSPNPINVPVLAGRQQILENVAQLNGNAAVAITVTSGGAWLSADAGAAAPAPFSIVVNATFLTASTTPYQGNLLIQCITGTSCVPLNVPVNLTVYAQIALTCTPTAGPAQVGVAYSSTCAVTGGNNSYLWSLGAGALPSGLSLSSTTGNTIRISGTPAVAGPYSYTIRVNDTSAVAPQTATQIFSGTITAAAPTTLSASPANLSFGSYIVGGTPPGAQNISLSSTSPASGLAFTSTLGSDCAWLTLSPTAGSTPATLNASSIPPTRQSVIIPASSLLTRAGSRPALRSPRLLRLGPVVHL